MRGVRIYLKEKSSFCSFQNHTFQLVKFYASTTRWLSNSSLFPWCVYVRLCVKEQAAVIPLTMINGPIQR